MMRRTLLAAAAGSALLGFVSCTDDTIGPRAPVNGQLAVVPSFGTLQGGIVEIARARFVFTRIPGGAVAKDTVVTIPAGADSVDLTLTVPVLTPGETFTLTIALISPAGDTVFRAGPLEVAPSTSGTPVPVVAPFTYVGTGANAAGVRVLSPDTSTFSGEVVVLTAEAFDGAAAAIPNTPIGWASLDTGRVQVTTDAQYRGVAVGGSQRGVARLVATLVTGQQDTVLVRNQPLPTAIAADSGSGQSARADSTLPQRLVARVTAGDGLGVAGLWVHFGVTSGAGTLSADSVRTDSTGRAAVQLTLLRSFQPHVVTATTPRLGTLAATFTATLLFEPPDALEIAAGDGQTAVAGSAVAVAPQVRVLDAAGLPVPGVTVSFAVTAGGGSVTGASPVTDTLGLAAVTGWTLGTTAGPNTLTATVGALTIPFTATGIAGPATQLVLVSGDAQADTAGALLPQPLVVRAEDANGNAVAGATVDWVAGAGSVSAPTTVTDAAGETQVTWTLGTTPGVQAASATLNGTTATVGFTATATAGPAARLAFTVEPTNVREDSVITPAVVVTAYDGFGNVAAGFAGTVQLALLTNPGGATLSGTTATAAVAGIATFADLTLNAFANGYTLEATAPGLVPDTSVTFNVQPPIGQAYWGNAAGGNWSDGANWIGGAAPGPGDTAYVTLDGAYTVTLDVGVTVARLEVGAATGAQIVDANGQTATATNGVVVRSTGTLVLDGSTLSASVVLDGAMQLDDGTITGLVTIGPTGTLAAGGIGAVVNGNVINNGTLTVQAFASGQANLAVTGTVNNGVGAQLTQADPGTLATGLANDGVVVVAAAMSLAQPDAEHSNTGTIQVTGGNLAVSQSGTAPSFTSSGTITVGAGRTFAVAGGTFAHAAGGILDGQGTVDLTGTSSAALDGSVNPGTSPGLLTLALPAGATLGTNALVTIELGADPAANPPGVDNDLLAVTNNLLALGGTLDVALVGAYVPAGTETWPLLAGVSGSFDLVNLPPLDYGWITYLQGDTLYLGPPPVVGPPTWTGAVSTDWFTAANWNGGVVPNSDQDDAVIPAGLGTYPVLTASPTVRDLTVEAGATIDVGTSFITVWGSAVDASGAITGTGFVVINSPATTISGQFPNLSVQGAVTVVGAVSTVDTLEITGAGAQLILNGQTVTVGGRFRFPSGELVMTRAGDLLDVGGDVAWTAAQAESNLTTGTIVFRGPSLAVGGASAFLLGGTLVQFSGTVPQTVSFTNPGPGTGQHFFQVIFGNPAGVALTSGAHATGLAQVQAGTLDLGGNTFDVGGSFSTVGTGTLTMLDPAATLNVAGSLSFAGGSTAGLMDAGTINASGNLGQSGTEPEAFHPGGSHVVNFVGSGQHFITIQDSDIGPGVPSSHFANITVSGSGPVYLNTDAYAHSTLTVPAGVTPTIGDPAGAAGPGRKLAVGGLDVDGLVLSHVTFEYNGMTTFPALGTFTRFDNVTFQDFASTDTQLRVVHPGRVAPFDFTNLIFSTAPTAGGLYVFAADSTVGDDGLTINLLNATPADGNAFTQEDGGAVVNWPTPQPGIINYVGGAAGLWSAPASWDLGRAPIAGDTVYIVTASAVTVTLDQNADVAYLSIDATSGISKLVGTGFDLAITGDGTPGQLFLGAGGGVDLTDATITVNTIQNEGNFVTRGTSAVVASAMTTQPGAFWQAFGTATIDHPTTYDFQTYGGVIVPDGATLTFGPNGALSYFGGTLEGGPTGTGVIALTPNVGLILGANATLDAVTLQLDNGFILPLAAEVLTVGPTATLVLQGTPSTGTTVSAPVVNEGTVLALGTQNDVGAPFTNASTGLLRLEGQTATAVLTVNALLDNSGTVTLTQSQGATGATLQVPLGLTNQALGEIVSDPGAGGGARAINGPLNNAGTFTVDYPLTLGGIDAQHTNLGTINIQAGNLTVSQTGNATRLSNLGPSGQIQSAAGYSLVFTGIGSMENTSGSILILSGLTAPDTLFVRAGAQFFTTDGAVIDVSGVLDGDLSGDVIPVPGAAATTTFTGDLPQSLASTIVLELGGVGASDLIEITGTGTMNGTIDAGTLLEPYVPAAGDTIPIMIFGQAAGEPAIVLPTPPGGLTVSAHSVDNAPGTSDTLYITFAVPPTPGITWTGAAANTSWNDPGNWDKNRVPGTGPFTGLDTVYIDVASAIVTMDVNATVRALELTGAGAILDQFGNILQIDSAAVIGSGATYQLASGGQLTGNGAVTVHGTFDWGGGTLGGAGTVTVSPSGTMAWSGDNKTLLQRDIVLNAPATWSAGNITVADGGVITNNATLSWTGSTLTVLFQGASSGGDELVNNGTLLLDGVANLGVEIPFTNNDTVDVTTGALDVNGAFTHATGAVLRGTGTLDLLGATVAAFDGNVAPGTSPGRLTLVAPAGVALGATSAVTIELGGTGAAGTDYDQLVVTSQLLTLGGTLDVTLIDPFVPAGNESWPILTGVTGSFATVNLPPGVGDTVTINDTLFLGTPTPANLNAWTGGAGDGLWNSAGNWSKNAAPVATDSVVIDAAGTYTVTIGTGLNPTIDHLLLGDIAGTQTLDLNGNDLTVTNTTTVEAGGDLFVRSTLTSGIATVNRGQIRITSSTLSGGLDNQGTVVATSATISGPVTTTVTSIIRTEGAVDFGSGFTNNGLLALGGDGTSGFFRIAGGSGTVVNAATGTVTSVAASGSTINRLIGNLENQGTVEVSEVQFNLAQAGAVLTNSGTINVSGANLSLATGPTGVFTTTGPINVSDGRLVQIQGPTFNIAPGGSIQGGGALGFAGGALTTASPLVIGPAGLDSLRAFGATLGGAGSITVESGGTVLFFNTTANIPVSNAGLVSVQGTSTAAVAFVNQGTLEVLDLITFTGDFTHAAGAVIRGTDTINVSGATILLAGDVAPGTSPGTLAWLGNFPQETSSTLNIELGGLTPGTSDLLDESLGAVTLAGVLNVTNLPGFLTDTITTFTAIPVLVADAITGSFITENLPTPPPIGTINSRVATGGTRDTLFIEIDPFGGAPPGTEAAWTGAVSTDWETAGNWTPAAVPDLTTNVWIPAAPLNQPAISTFNPLADSLVLEAGATLTIADDAGITLLGSLDAGFTSIVGSGTGTGLVLMAGPGNVRGRVPNLQVNDSVVVADSLLVDGELVITGDLYTAPPTTPATTPHKIFIGGGLSVVGTGRLNTVTQGGAATGRPDSVFVGGTALFDGQSTSTRLVAGVLVLEGDFVQNATTSVNAFAPSGTHKTAFTGPVTQNVSFLTPATGASRFNDLEIAGEGGVTFGTPVEIVGATTVTSAVPVVGLDSIRTVGGLAMVPTSSLTTPMLEIGGTLNAPIGGFNVDTVMYRAGITSLPDSLPYQVLKIGTNTGAPAQVALSGPTTVAGDLLIDGPNGSRLLMNGQKLTVGGNLLVGYPQIGRGHIEMTSAADSLVVLGNASFRGASTGLQANVKWTAGFLDVKGDFEQLFPAGQPQTFAADPPHMTIFAGDAAQNITFTNPDTSRFGRVRIANTAAPVTLASNARAIGDVTLATGSELNLGTATFAASGGGVFNHDDAAAITTQGAATLDIAATVIGGGSVRGDYRPGGTGAAGHLTIVGTWPVDVQSAVALELGGRTTPGVDADLITVTGTPVPLNAALTVSLINGFTLQIGDTLPVMVFAGGTPLSKFPGGITLPVQGGVVVDTLWANVPAGPDTLYIVAKAAPLTVNAWTGALSTLWGTDGNWSLGRVPQAGDSVVIDLAGAYTVDVNVSDTVAFLFVGTTGTPTIAHTNPDTLRIEAGGLFGNTSVVNMGNGGVLETLGTVTFGGTVNWTAGSNSTFRGPGTISIAPGGALNMTGSGTKNLDGVTLVNAGTATWSGGNIEALTTATIFNQAPGVLDIQADLFMYANGTGPTLLNTGTIGKSAGTGKVWIDWPFTNTGSVDVQSGSIDLRGPFAHQAGTASVSTGDSLIIKGGSTIDGAITVASGGVLQLDDATANPDEGNHVLSGTSSVTGAGTVDINDAFLVTIGGAYDVGNTTVVQTQVRFTGPDTAKTVNGTFGAGGLGGGLGAGGTGILGISGAFTWASGTLRGTGKLSVLPGGTLTLTGANSKNVDSLDIDVAGTLVWGGTADLDPSNGVAFNVLAGGTFDVQSDQFLFNADGTTTFANAGTLVKSAGAGITTIRPPVTNTGIIDVQAATLQLRGLTHQAGATIRGSGVLDVASATPLTLNGDVSPGTSPGLLTLAGPYTPGASAALNIEVNGFTLGTQYDRLAVTGAATLNGSLKVTQGAFTPTTADTFPVLIAPTITGTFPSTDIPAGLTLAYRTAGTTDSVVLIGTAPTAATWLGGDAGGPTDWSNPNNWDSGFVPGGSTDVTIPATANDPILSNAAAVDSLTLQDGAALTLAGFGLAANDLVNGGTLDVGTGTMDVNGVLLHSAGGTLRGSGTLDLTGATVSAFDGAVNPGSSPGLLGIVAPSGLTLGPTAAVNVELGGTAPGAEYDRLITSGNGLGVDGAMNISLINNFTPLAADSFEVLTFGARTGTFASVAPLDLGGGLVLDTLWSSTGLALQARRVIATDGSPVDLATSTPTDRVYGLVVPGGAGTSVVAFDASTHAPIDTTPLLDAGNAFALGVNAATEKLYISDFFGGVFVLDGLAGEQIGSIPASQPGFPTIDEAKNLVYLAASVQVLVPCEPFTCSIDLPALLKIDGEQDTIFTADTVHVGGQNDQAFGAAFNPNDGFVYVAVYEVPGYVKIVDPTTNALVDSIAVPDNPWAVAINPVTNRLYVTSDTDNSVTAVDLDARSVLATIPVGGYVPNVSVDVALDRVYVPNFDASTVVIIDGATNSVVKTLEAGGASDGAYDAVLSPAAPALYVARYNAGEITVTRR